MAKRLTLKESAFVQHYCAGTSKTAGNGLESAIAAGYQGTPKSLRVTASQILRRPHVVKAMDKLTSKAVKRSGLTVDKVLAQLEETRVAAVKVGNYGAAVRCIELTGKYLKMFTERIEQVHTLENISTADLLALIQEIAEQGNVNLSQLIAGDGAERGDLPDPAEPTTTH